MSDTLTRQLTEAAEHAGKKSKEVILKIDGGAKPQTSSTVLKICVSLGVLILVVVIIVIMLNRSFDIKGNPNIICASEEIERAINDIQPPPSYENMVGKQEEAFEGEEQDDENFITFVRILKQEKQGL